MVRSKRRQESHLRKKYICQSKAGGEDYISRRWSFHVMPCNCFADNATYYTTEYSGRAGNFVFLVGVTTGHGLVLDLRLQT